MIGQELVGRQSDAHPAFILIPCLDAAPHLPPHKVIPTPLHVTVEAQIRPIYNHSLGQLLLKDFNVEASISPWKFLRYLNRLATS